MLKKVEVRKVLGQVVREQIAEVVGFKAMEEACRRATASSDTLGTRTP
jgi:hypothetical protein